MVKQAHIGFYAFHNGVSRIIKTQGALFKLQLRKLKVQPRVSESLGSETRGYPFRSMGLTLTKHVNEIKAQLYYPKWR